MCAFATHFGARFQVLESIEIGGSCTGVCGTARGRSI